MSPPWLPLGSGHVVRVLLQVFDVLGIQGLSWAAIGARSRLVAGRPLDLYELSQNGKVVDTPCLWSVLCISFAFTNMYCLYVASRISLYVFLLKCVLYLCICSQRSLFFTMYIENMVLYHVCLPCIVSYYHILYIFYHVFLPCNYMVFVHVPCILPCISTMFMYASIWFLTMYSIASALGRRAQLPPKLLEE